MAKPMTRIVLDVPDDIAAELATAWGDVSRGALEAVAVEGHRDGTLGASRSGAFSDCRSGRPKRS
jgi:hypothetical protein